MNIAAMLVKLGWNGLGLSQEAWAIMILLVAAGLVVLVMLSLRNAAFPLPVAWAYLGIYLFRSPEGFGGQYGAMQIVTLAGMAVLIGAAAIQFYRNHYVILPVSNRGALAGK